MRPIYKCVDGRYVENPNECIGGWTLLIDPVRRVKLSKLISGILRHFPQEACVEPDSEGWVKIDELVRGIKKCWHNRELYQWVTYEHVVAIARLDPKGRFELKNGMIRARYGHSFRVFINYPRIKWDKPLYHGTSLSSLKSILKEGIKPMKRQYVHLTIDEETAIDTGRRHGKPVVLIIDPKCLERHGYELLYATDRIFLTKYVPPDCIVRVKKI